MARRSGDDPGGRRRRRVVVEGVVQGVGFRPFVHALATELGLSGHVGNDPAGVFIEIEGGGAALDAFVVRLRSDAPPLASIDRVEVQGIAPRGDHSFEITSSDDAGERSVLVAPDVATCDDCRREVADPAERRHRYPFTNCTNCGPRYTIVRDVPYDRRNTTMDGFALCGDCDREYHDRGDRRFHAQPVCCPRCGPRLTFVEGDSAEVTGDLALRRAAARLLLGAIVAVKGLGGYHLAVLASDEDAAARLRARKHREDKPFAVMVRDLSEAGRLCELSPLEAELLLGRARPIVLLPRRDERAVAASVAPGNRSLGLLLPYTPLHELLLDAVGAPLVLTSGNLSDEPIAFRDDEACDRLAPIADAFLRHDRPIHVRVDDSVVRPMAGRAIPVRRSRGYAPAAVALPVSATRHVLAVGAELKSTICVARGRHAFVSEHIGDLENFATFRAFEASIEHLTRLFDVTPAIVAHDLHPEYLSTKHALEQDEVELLGVQHHHAHIASCLADNGETERVVGVAFDGTGFGPDGTIWGGEILVADLEDWQRVAHLAPVPMPGGAAAVRQPWRMAASYLRGVPGGTSAGLDVVGRNRERWDQVLAVAAAGVNSPLTSSAGRLFDAVASILGVRDEITYEGQAAIELEQVADPGEDGAYTFGVDRPVGEALRLRGGDLVDAVVEDLTAGVPRERVAARFHNGVAAGVAAVCRQVADEHRVDTVALSGGVFQNVLLTERLLAALEAVGLRVLTHRQVPPNDGGISLGQAAVAAAVSSRRT